MAVAVNFERDVGVDEDRSGMEDDENFEEVTRPKAAASEARTLYVSHALSTWNARGYEFAAVSSSHTLRATER